MQFIRSLNTGTTGIVPVNYLFEFNSNDSSNEIQIYEGWLTLSKDMPTTNTTDFFLAGTVNTDE